MVAHAFRHPSALCQLAASTITAFFAAVVTCISEISWPRQAVPSW